MAAKKKYINYTSPAVIAQYPKLDKPMSWDDAANRSVTDPDGQYETRGVASADEAKDLIASIKQAIAESGLKPKHVPFADEEDEEGDNTGNVVFRFKAYGKDKDGEPNVLKFFDAAGNLVKGKVRVTAGSTIRVMGWISVAKMGARLNIRQIQIINLAERNDGFDAYAGGSFSAADVDGGNNNKNETFSATQEAADDSDIPF